MFRDKSSGPIGIGIVILIDDRNGLACPTRFGGQVVCFTQVFWIEASVFARALKFGANSRSRAGRHSWDAQRFALGITRFEFRTDRGWRGCVGKREARCCGCRLGKDTPQQPSGEDHQRGQPACFTPLNPLTSPGLPDWTGVHDPHRKFPFARAFDGRLTDLAST
jgi:hypothetical protein